MFIFNIINLVASFNIYLNKSNYLFFEFLSINPPLPHLHYSVFIFLYDDYYFL